MRVLILGATGMVGQGVLRECLRDPAVEAVLSVVRAPTGAADPKLRELAHGDFLDWAGAEGELTGWDACLWCLGVTSAGMSEADYTRITADFPLAAARTLVRVNPGMAFVYVSGAGADSSGTGSVMWARVKGRAENELLALPFPRVHAVRPAAIQPLHGIRSRTAWIRVATALMKPFFPALRALFPGQVITTEELGRAMLRLAREGHPKPVLESRDLRALGKA